MYILRKATVEDASAIAEVDRLKLAWDDHQIKEFPVPKAEAIWTAFLTQQIENRSVYLVLDCFIVVGLAAILETRDRVHILSLSVLFDYRESGVKETLYNYVEYVAKVAQKPLQSCIS